MDSIIPESGTEPRRSAEPAAAKKTRVVRKPKPLVEGINTPKTTNDVVIVKSNLSPREKEPVADAAEAAAVNTVESIQIGQSKREKPEVRLMPESVARSVNKKNHHIGRWLLVFTVCLILVAGAYEFYVWELSKNQQPVLGHYHSAASDAYGASQPFPLAGGTASASSSLTAGSVMGSSTSASAATTVPASAMPTDAVLQVKINSTPTGFLNVRNSPSSSGAVVTQAHPGEVYTYTKVQNNWYQITYSGFSTGWVSGQYVTKQ